jgi:hypothetical protein
VTVDNFAELSSASGGSVQAFFAVDIISFLPGFGGNTGWVDASTPGTSVPDGGATITLLGSVLFGLGMLRRRFGKS